MGTAKCVISVNDSASYDDAVGAYRVRRFGLYDASEDALVDDIVPVDVVQLAAACGTEVGGIRYKAIGWDAGVVLLVVQVIYTTESAHGPHVAIVEAGNGGVVVTQQFTQTSHGITGFPGWGATFGPQAKDGVLMRVSTAHGTTRAIVTRHGLKPVAGIFYGERAAYSLFSSEDGEQWRYLTADGDTGWEVPPT